jgi:hypothetical protein
MDVAIAGGHGKVARLLAARGDRVRGLIRNPGDDPIAQALSAALT